MKIVVVSGGFDPLHSGHISYFKAAKKLGDKLIVCLNSDEWLKRKKGKEFLPFSERKLILEEFSVVDQVLSFDDDDLGSCINGLESVKSLYPNDEIIFCNGGDRNSGNCPEQSVKGITCKFSVGGNDKLNSSSWILRNWQFEFEDRIWGRFYNLFNDHQVKLKELIVKPKKGMSFQRHFHRSEIWLVSKGKCLVNFSKDDPKKITEIKLSKHDFLHVPITSWHQITNPYEEDCHILEIQYGNKTEEEDIERLYHYS